MAIQAVIMAGGEGERLRPLTSHTPKPLCPLLGEPVMGYAVRLLRRHQITEIGVTLWYQPHKIRRAFKKGEDYGVRLKYFEEKEPVGTAGSVKMARKHLTETFFVLSGDGLTDCDLTKAMAFHREKKSLATLVLKRVGVPLPYGVVLTDQESRITRFIEKPDWQRVFSDLVNTGIYILEPEILEYIPSEGMPDFGKDIFPALLAGGLPVYGYETEGYWCDVGDQRAYLQAQMDLLEGKVKLPHAAGTNETARIDATARIEGNCLIGPNVEIGPGALIKNAVIGSGAWIGPGAVVENSCLWDGVSIQEKASVSGSVVCDGAVVRPGAELPDGCALGQRAIVGAYAQLRPGVKVWPHFRVSPGAVVSRHVTAGDWAAPQWTGQGVSCDTSESVCAVCAAFCKVTGGRRVITGSRGNAALESLAAGALSAAGMQVVSVGEAAGPMLGAVIRALRYDGGVFVSGQNLQFFDRSGMPLSTRQASAMDGCVLRQNGAAEFVRPGEIQFFSGAEELYLAQIMPDTAGLPLFSPLAVFCESPLLRRIAEEGLRRMGGRDVRVAAGPELALRPGETGFQLSADGRDFIVFTGARTLTREQKTLLLLGLFFQKTGKLFDLSGVPRAAEKIAPLQFGGQGGEAVSQRALLQDGLAGIFLLADALRHGPLETLLESVPETHILTRDIPCGLRDKGRILHRLCDQTKLPRTLGEGVRITHERGCATIVPDAHRNSVRVISESADSEFARELCDFYLAQIRNLTENRET